MKGNIQFVLLCIARYVQLYEYFAWILNSHTISLRLALQDYQLYLAYITRFVMLRKNIQLGALNIKFSVHVAKLDLQALFCVCELISEVTAFKCPLCTIFNFIQKYETCCNLCS